VAACSSASFLNSRNTAERSKVLCGVWVATMNGPSIVAVDGCTAVDDDVDDDEDVEGVEDDSWCVDAALFIVVRLGVALGSERRSYLYGWDFRVWCC
jgi:hypothetical protein